MIVEVRGGELVLSGSLVRNEWSALASAVHLALDHSPTGVLIDGTELVDISPDGAETLRLALKAVERSGARLVFVGSAEARTVVRQIRDLGSRLPSAASVQDARASLGMPNSAQSRVDMVVSLVAQEGDRLTLAFAQGWLRRSGRPLSVLIALILEVPRELPIDAALGTGENDRKERIAAFASELRKQGHRVQVRVERTRDLVQRLKDVVGNCDRPVLLASQPPHSVSQGDLADLLASTREAFLLGEATKR